MNMKFEVDKCYMHEKAMDCFIVVLTIERMGYGVAWWNLGFTGRPWALDDITRLPFGEESHWYEINPYTERVCG